MISVLDSVVPSSHVTNEGIVNVVVVPSNTVNLAPDTLTIVPKAEHMRLTRMRDEVREKFAALKIVSCTASTTAESPFAVSRQVTSMATPSPPTIPLRRSVSSTAEVAAVRPDAPSCVVCMGPCSVQTKNICPSRCEGGNMCLMCSHKLWKSWLQESRYVVAPPKCVGCKAPVSVEVWRTNVREPEFDRLKANLQSLFIIRCQYCDSDCNFFCTTDAYNDDQRAIVIDTIQQKCLAHGGDIAKAEFLAAMEAFTNYQGSAARLVDSIVAGAGSKVARSIFVSAEFLNESGPTHAGFILPLFRDVERRAALQLEYFRRPDSRISTSCCLAPQCFACKHDGWHDGETCQEVMARAWDDTPIDGEEKIFQCPECFVHCMHAGGCAHIRCICGHEYTLGVD